MSDETKAYCGLQEYEYKENKRVLMQFIEYTGGAIHRKLLTFIENEWLRELEDSKKWAAKRENGR